MKKFLYAGMLLCMVFFATTVKAGDSTGIKWTFAKERLNGGEVTVSIKAFIPAGLKLYALQTSEADALYSTVSFDSVARKYALDSLLEKRADTDGK